VVEDVVQGVSLPVWALYPTLAPERTVAFGDYEVAVAMDAPIEGAGLPVVLISHGNSGSPWVHRGLALHLVRAGFVVVLPEHLGNSRSDNSLAGTVANLRNRPRHVKLALDAVEGALGVATGAVAVIGHSIGAYTALAVAGGRPTSFAHEGAPPGPVEVVHDPRVRALVLLAPAAMWYRDPGALDGVTVPIMARAGELDGAAPPAHAELVVRGLPDGANVDYRLVAGAGHFSFQSPFPAAMVRPDFPPAQDPTGFDRAAYQLVLESEVLAFLRTGPVVRSPG
jgi:predicted dienelactone hydrolase